MSAERKYEVMIDNFENASLGLEYLKTYLIEIVSSYESTVNYLENGTNLVYAIVNPLKDNILAVRKKEIENINEDIESLKKKINGIINKLTDEKEGIRNTLN